MLRMCLQMLDFSPVGVATIQLHCSEGEDPT
jgi:hypothetical protein